MRAYILLACLLMIGSLFASDLVMDGDRVYWTQDGRTISAAPAYGQGKVITQFINVSSSNPNQVAANFSFVFGQPIIWGKAYYWQNTNHPYTTPIIKRINGQATLQIANFTAIPPTNDCRIGDIENSLFYNITLANGTSGTVCFNTYNSTGDVYTLNYAYNATTGQQSHDNYYYDWSDISEGFAHTTIGSKTVFTYYDVSVANGNNHQVKFVYEVPFGATGKYDIYAHSGTPEQAAAGTAPIYVALDPWFNASYAKRMQVLCGNITTSNHPIMINGTSGFSIGGLTQRVWTSCQPDLYLYYNDGNYSTYIVANNSSAVPFEVEYGNGTSYLPQSVWKNASAILATHFEIKTGVAYDSAYGVAGTAGTYTNATGLWGNAVAFDSGGITRYISFPHAAQYNLNAVSFEIWWSALGAARVDDVITKEDGGNLRWGIATNGAGQHSVIPQKGSGTLADSTQWAFDYGHITATAGNTSEWNTTTYQTTSGTAASSAIVNNTEALFIGANNGYNGDANFTVEEIRIYNMVHPSSWANESRENQLGRYNGYGNLGASESSDAAPTINTTYLTNTTGGTAFYKNKTILAWANITAGNAFNITWKWIRNGTVMVNGSITNFSNNTLYNFANLSAENTTSAGYVWNLELKAIGTGGNTTQNTSNNATITNRAPYITTNMTFMDATIGHWFKANSTVADDDGASDITFYNLTITVGGGTCAKLSNSTSGTSYTAQYNCTTTEPATPTIKMLYQDSSGASIETNSVANPFPDNAPSLAAPSITPSSPTYQNNLTCNAGAYSDIDGDTENVSARIWRWYLNGSLIAGATSATLNNSSFAVGSSVMCMENATNSTWTPVASANSSAVVILAVSTVYTMNAVSLSQSPIIFNTSVNCLANSSFTNGSATLNFEWYVNYILVKSGTYTMNLSQANTSVSIDTLAAAYMDFGDLVLCQARVWDGSSYSAFRASGISSVQEISNSLTIYPLPAMILLFWESWQVYLVGLFAVGLSWIVWGLLDRTLFSAALLCWVGWLALGEFGLFYFGILYFVMGLVARFSIGK